MFRNPYRNVLYLTVVAGIGVCGCSWSSANSRKTQPTFVLPTNADEARTKLLAASPPGTDMGEVRQRLADRGFHVAAGSDEEFSARLDSPPRGLVTTNWLLVVTGEQGKLKDISVEVHYTGP